VRANVIVGGGDLGGALALHLAAADIAARVVLVDAAASVAAGKALDIRQAAPVDRYHTILEGTADESRALAADAVVLADRFGAGEPGTGEWQSDAGVGLVQRIAHLNPRALILCAGARQLDVIERSVREIGLPRQRIIGSAPEALRAAIVSMVTLEGVCVPADVSLTIVGRPPGQIIVPWEDASIGGRRATDVLPPPAITRLDTRLPRLWPPGPLTLAAAATRTLGAAASGTPRSVAAFVAVTRDEGDRGRVAMLPITLANRAVTVLTPTLSTRDRVRLDTVLLR
jgi:malate/lactate dehydrogenase